MQDLQKDIFSLSNERISNQSHNIAVKLKTQQSEAEDILINKNILYILIGFWLFGLLLAFTPCVLPLILIMIGFLGGRCGGISKTRIILLALTYVLTLSLTYTIAGVLTALSGSYIQEDFQKPWVLITASLLFIVLALSMLNIYKIKMPDHMHHALLKYHKYRESYSYLQVALMAILATLIAAPCIVAPLVGALSYVGKTGNIMLGGIALFAMGVGIGTPLLIGAMIGIHVIPKSLTLQELNKTFFGIVLLGIAIWLLNNIISSFISMILWSMLVIFSVIYVNSLFKAENNIQLFGKTLCVIFLSYGISIFIGALLGITDPLHPLKFHLHSNESPQTKFTVINNNNDFTTQFTLAKNEQKPILLFFTSNWCISCKRLEKNVFSDYNVAELTQKFILLSINIDTQDPALMYYVKKYQIFSSPEILFLNANGEEINTRIVGYIDINEMITILQNVQLSSQKGHI